MPVKQTKYWSGESYSGPTTVMAENITLDPPWSWQRILLWTHHSHGRHSALQKLQDSLANFFLETSVYKAQHLSITISKHFPLSSLYAIYFIVTNQK